MIMFNDKDYCLILTNVSSREEGEEIASALVEDRLVACVNISSPVTSLYHWQGEINKDEELMLFMKTKKNLYKKVEERIKRLHSYELPEVIAVPIESGSKEYFSWITENTLDS